MPSSPNLSLPISYSESNDYTLQISSYDSVQFLCIISKICDSDNPYEQVIIQVIEV
jgi:hypothetical protein